MRFVAGQGAGAQNHREANPAQVHQIACQGAVAESHREAHANRDKQCGLLIDEDGEVVPSEYLLRHSLEL